MMGDCSILDVSALVHTGMNNVHFQGRTYYQYPVGGIHYLMRYICNAFNSNSFVVLCFDSPSFRNKLSADYKSGRIRNAAVISQIQTIYEAMSRCGIKCEKYEGFEADDIIDWAAKLYAGDRYCKAKIYGNDYDLCHSVQVGVSFEPIRSGLRQVTTANFENTVELGKDIMFNTISAYKVCAGCNSDKIPAFKPESIDLSGYKLYKAYTSWIKEAVPNAQYDVTIKPDLLRFFLIKVLNISQNDQKELERRIALVYPAVKPEHIEIVPTARKQVNMKSLATFLSMYDDKDSITSLGLRRATLSDSEKQIVRDKALALSRGEFAADHDLPNTNTRLASARVITMDSFTRDF